MMTSFCLREMKKLRKVEYASSEESYQGAFSNERAFLNIISSHKEKPYSIQIA